MPSVRLGGSNGGGVGHFTPKGALYGSSSLGAAVTPSGQNGEQQSLLTCRDGGGGHHWADETDSASGIRRPIS